MKLTSLLDLASLQKKLLASPTRFLLVSFSWLYAAVISIRNRLYTLGVFKARRLPCHIISVGNIVVGGTGKTPAVIAIAKHLQAKNVRVGILMRGYKRQSREKVTIVSDGEKVCASLRESGDEAYMMAQHLSGIPIIVGGQRYQAGQIMLERFDVDVLLLDDGFQHWQLARDVDILTLSTKHPFGDPQGLLPAGILREPPIALRRADVILLTHTDTTQVLPHTQKVVSQLAPNALVLESIHQPVHVYPLLPKMDAADIDSRSAVKVLGGKRILAVCGIGQPETFVATLMRCSPESVELLAFPDHHDYTEVDVRQMNAAFQAAAADLIVVTQKDAQKLASLVIEKEFPIVVLEIALIITEGVEKLTDVLLSNR